MKGRSKKSSMSHVLNVAELLLQEVFDKTLKM